MAITLLKSLNERKCWKIERRIKIRELRSERLFQLIRESDIACISELRMDRRTFRILCDMLRDVGGISSFILIYTISPFKE
uniref:Uncharacterized protein n=1 Tax=Oryza glumipatula TaxID=40148 RepID=A0A0D9YRH2_9ORYZ